jgi:3-dehydroquinate dehydratase-2
MLGVREPEIYGTVNWKDIEKRLKKCAIDIDCSIIFFQSNHEGEIVDFIQKNIKKIDAIIINPASLSKTGYSILDALNSQHIPYIEVHLSNISSRGGWHKDSIFTKNSVGCILGFKSFVYLLGLYAANNYLEEKNGERIDS